MGLRFRKSFKIIPGVKVNLNKKSTSITFGGKGVHYTINSKGTKTKSVGIPGTGLYYTETSNQKQNSVPPKDPTPPTQHASPPDDNKNDKKKKGCLFYLLVLLAICACLIFLPLLWIPAIGFIIFFAIKKDTRKTKRRNILVSVAVLIISFIAFFNIDTSDTLTGIQADWKETTYDVSETAQVKITPTPSDAEVQSLELSDNNIAKLDYSDGKAVITFKEPGKSTLYFIANGNVDSNSTTITVTDKAAEEARKAEEEAKQKAEEEAKAAEESKKEAEAAAQAQKEAEEAAAKQAEEEARIKSEQEAAAAQAQQEQQTTEQSNIQQEQQQYSNQNDTQQTQQPQEQLVWIPKTGSKYHSNPSCSGMNNPREVTLSEAQSMGYEPCKKCY